jgi:tetratricopeptide (TPR) repeat protein
MNNEEQPYNIATIRELLLAAFTPEALRRFCLDRTPFRPILDNFGPKYNLNDMVDQVLLFCETQLLFNELLAEVQQCNPKQYNRFRSGLFAPSSALPSVGKPPLRDPTIPRPPQPHFSRRFALQANFTGRRQERQLLTKWLAHDLKHVLMLVAMGGMGKSSLAWVWLQNDIDQASLDGVLWWSFDEGETGFARFLSEAILYVSNQQLGPNALPSAYDRVRTLVNLLQERSMLLVLDGFERQLQAYGSLNAAYQSEEAVTQTADARACLDPYAAQFLTDMAAGPTKTKILITTRLMLSDLEGPGGEPLHGCQIVRLGSLLPEDAVRFMREQGVTQGTDAEVSSACRSHGFHPLSLRLLSGLIKRDKRRTGDIAVAAQYHAHATLLESRREVLAAAYTTLQAPLRLLLSRVAALRSAATYDTLLVFDEFQQQEDFDQALDELGERGLLSFDSTHGLFDMHPLVRAYAYDRLVDPMDAHARLREHFASIPAPGKDAIRSIEDLSSIIERFHHTVNSGQPDDAWALYESRLRIPLYYEFCAYELEVQLLSSLLGAGQAPPRLQDAVAQTWVLIYLSMCYERMGQLPSALARAEQAVTLNRKGGRPADLGSSLVALASVFGFLGQLRAALESSREAVAIFDQIADMNWFGISHREYAHHLILCGELDEAARQLDLAEEVYSWRPHQFAHGLISSRIHRADIISARNDHQAALELIEETYETAVARRYTREAVECQYRLGKFQVFCGRLDEAKANLEAVLQDCRRIRLAQVEPGALLGLARVHLALVAPGSEHAALAKRYAEKALLAANRSQYRLQQADIHNFLAAAARSGGQLADARQYARKARTLALCDGIPYAYQSALSEAEGMLDRSD